MSSNPNKLRTRWTRWMAALSVIAMLAACGERSSGPAPEATESHDAHAEQRDEHASDEHTDQHADEHAPGGVAHAEAPKQTRIAAQTAHAAGVRVAAVGAGVIADEHEVQGLLTPVEGRVAQVMARFPGPIRALRANVGDRVRAGQPLAMIESNLSLTNYTVASPLAGVVLARSASLGAVASEGMALYEIANLSELWVDLHIFGSDAQHITAGVPVTVTRMSDGVTAETTLERVLPGTATASQSTVARATIQNLDGLWRPGSAVKARVTVDRQDVPLVVPLTALQTADGGDVVYVRQGETYVTRPVKPGRRDAARVEILSGLKAGEQVVIEQSFLIKADIEKSSAAHEH